MSSLPSNWVEDQSVCKILGLRGSTRLVRSHRTRCASAFIPGPMRDGSTDFQPDVEREANSRGSIDDVWGIW